MAEVTERKHFYFAEATALSGDLHLPLRQEIKPQAFAKLSEEGGYLAQREREYRLESVLTYGSAYTQVTGNRDVKAGHGWGTVVTSVVEKLNLLDVVTADRVVAQISSEHPLEGYTPSYTFLGTRFENLRIAGHEVKLDLDLDLFADKAENDAPYTKSPGFVSRVTQQHARIRAHQKGLENPLTELLERYNLVPESFENSSGDEESVECSLVNKAEGTFPGCTYGHVIEVPNFGTIYLATVHLKHSDRQEGTGIPKKSEVHLKMIDARMGCIAAGSVTAGSSRTNGVTRP
jgi:hypothetical protein